MKFCALSLTAIALCVSAHAEGQGPKATRPPTKHKSGGHRHWRTHRPAQRRTDSWDRSHAGVV